MECDGKKCGEGKLITGNVYVCPHNNIEVKFPELAIEWSPDNEKPMCEYLPGSGKKVQWVCTLNPCGCHIWTSSICNRTGSIQSGCPYCSGRVCEHNNLEILHPELKLEWHPNNAKPMNSYAPHSHKKVLWLCQLNPCGCHEWLAPISDRTASRPKGCPFCSSFKLCDHNNLKALYPNLIEQWHPDNPKPMHQFAPNSHVSVLWMCSENPCGCHSWQAVISSRTCQKSRGCPYCANLKLCDHNNLEVMHPELKSEWHPENPKPMSSYSPGSDSKVKWICSNEKNCGCHVWEINIYCRTGPENGCPYCFNNKPCIHNNLEINYPELKKNGILKIN